MKKAELGKELVITVSNKIGVLADISKIIADHGINIVAVAGYAGENNTARIMLSTDDNLRAGDALRKKGYNSISEKEVVLLDLDNKAGALKFITDKLAANGIDIKYTYGTACLGSCPARIILSTDNNEKALVAFKK